MVTEDGVTSRRLPHLRPMGPGIPRSDGPPVSPRIRRGCRPRRPRSRLRRHRGSRIR
jgi:hypothetical protein